MERLKPVPELMRGWYGLNGAYTRWVFAFSL
jgi:hypothetical protein